MYGGIPWSICLPTVLPWVHLPTHHCTGVPGRSVHRAQCPDSDALGSEGEKPLGEEVSQPLRTLDVWRMEGHSAQSYSALP